MFDYDNATLPGGGAMLFLIDEAHGYYGIPE